MSLARGFNDRNRKPIIKHHRMVKFEEAFYKYCEGTVSIGYLTERANKLKEIRSNKSKNSKR